MHCFATITIHAHFDNDWAKHNTLPPITNQLIPIAHHLSSSSRYCDRKMPPTLTTCLHHATRLLTHIYVLLTGTSGPSDVEQKIASYENKLLQQEASRLDSAYGLISPVDCEDIPANWFDRLGKEFLATSGGFRKPKEERIRELKRIHLERLVNYEMGRRGDGRG